MGLTAACISRKQSWVANRELQALRSQIFPPLLLNKRDHRNIQNIALFQCKEGDNQVTTKMGDVMSKQGTPRSCTALGTLPEVEIEHW